MREEISAEATDVQRRFAYWKRKAQRTPVVVKNHGQDEIVMVAKEEYARLKRGYRREVLGLEDFTAEDVAAIAAAEPPPESAEFDDELEGWIP